MTTIRHHLQEILNRHQPPTNSNYCAFCEIRNPCPDNAAAQTALDLLNNSPIGTTEDEYRAAQGDSRWRHVADPILDPVQDAFHSGGARRAHRGGYDG